MSEVSEPGIYQMSNAVYQSDPCESPSLSSSGARKIIKTCPARYWYDRENPTEPTVALNIGNAAHDYLLTGKGWFDRNFVLPDDFNGRTKYGKAMRAEAEAAGKIVVTHDQFLAIKAMVQAIREHEFAFACFQSGEPEQSLFWKDEEFGLWCRARLDFLPKNLVFFADYKTTINAEPDYLSRAMYDLGYHQQAAWYLDGIKAALGTDLARFLFVFQEKAAPYLVTVAQPDHFAIEWGRIQNRKAKEIFARCLEADHWPGYAEDVVGLDLPNWAHSRLEYQKELGFFDIEAPALRKAG